MSSSARSVLPNRHPSLHLILTLSQAFNRRNSPQRSSDARNHQAGGPSTAAGRYPHGGPLISIHDYEYNHSSTGTGNNGGNGNNSDNSGNGGNNGNGGNSGNGGGTFTAQLVDVDILTRISEQRDFPRGPVPYTVHHSFTQHSQQRDVTPAGPMPSSIHVEKRVGRPNIDPRVWAIDDELKAAWRRHLKGKDKATESDEE